jgi:methyltransferase family protein
MAPELHKWLKKLPRRYIKYRQPAGLWSMTVPRELAFCQSFAREHFCGAGKMVDLGCWFGATTFSLARGLSRNRRAKNYRRIDAFDLFIWTKAMEPVARKINMPIVHRDGESFQSDVQKLLMPFADLVRLHQLNLMASEPDPGPIEFLFIDAMKTWPLAQKIAEDFFPRLIAGTSVVVHQDFIFHQPIAAAIHLLMGRLRDHFE